MFDFRRSRAPRSRASWLASVALHTVLFGLVVVVSWRMVPHVTFINLAPVAVPNLPELPPLGSGGRTGGKPGPKSPVPVTAPAHGVPTPVGPVEGPTDGHVAVQEFVVTPRLSDARIWAAPRPALPADVAGGFYGKRDRETVIRDSTVVRRLQAMVDSLNEVADDEQRDRKKPSWTANVIGKKYGLDSSGIYVAGVKIPTPALAALGNLLPAGNFDAAMRQHQMDDIRADILQAAQRTATLEQFRHYVHELRERKQEERDFNRNQRTDTTTAPAVVQKDSVKMVP